MTSPVLPEGSEKCSLRAVRSRGMYSAGGTGLWSIHSSESGAGRRCFFAGPGAACDASLAFWMGICSQPRRLGLGALFAG